MDPTPSRRAPRGVETPDSPRVLVVSDDVAESQDLAAMLDGVADVVACTPARHALDLTDAEGFHVVCIDAAVTSAGAADLLRRLMTAFGDAGFVVLTSPGDYARGAWDGRHHVVFKPVVAAKLVSAVQQLVRIAEMRRSVRGLSKLGQ
jgi:DNA-binding NtrC family response regulator